MIYMFKVIHFYQEMFLKILETCMEVYGLDPVYFFLSAPGLALQACLRKTGVK